MPGDEQKSRNRPKNHARLAVSLVLAILKNCLKRLSEAHTTRTKPWPTRPPTSDNNPPITKRIRTNENPKCFSNLGDCSRLSKEARR